MTKVINLFAGPGTGKSTIAAGLFYKMKTSGLSVEFVSEYAKEVTWENNQTKLEDQFYITANQNRRLWRLRKQVDWIITDSPLLLGLHYVQPTYFPKFFRNFLIEVWHHYDNVNFLLTRTSVYNPIGRNQTEEEAKQIDLNIKVMLDNMQIPYLALESDDKTVDRLFKEITK